MVIIVERASIENATSSRQMNIKCSHKYLSSSSQGCFKAIFLVCFESRLYKSGIKRWVQWGSTAQQGLAILHLIGQSNIRANHLPLTYVVVFNNYIYITEDKHKHDAMSCSLSRTWKEPRPTLLKLGAPAGSPAQKRRHQSKSLKIF